MVCLELRYYDKLREIPIKRHYCLDIWDKECLVDSFWFLSEKARSKFIEETYILKRENYEEKN